MPASTLLKHREGNAKRDPTRARSVRSTKIPPRGRRPSIVVRGPCVANGRTPPGSFLLAPSSLTLIVMIPMGPLLEQQISNTLYQYFLECYHCILARIVFFSSFCCIFACVGTATMQSARLNTCKEYGTWELIKTGQLIMSAAVPVKQARESEVGKNICTKS